MKSHIFAILVLFASAANAQFGWGGYGYNNNCPVELLTSLSGIVSNMYGSSMYGPYGGGVMSGLYGSGAPLAGAGFSGYGSGYQAQAGPTAGVTGNPFNPTCPWGLINSMIQQIAEYSSQMQAAQQSGLPVTPGVPGAPGAASAFSSGFARGGVPYAMPRAPFRK